MSTGTKQSQIAGLVRRVWLPPVRVSIKAKGINITGNSVKNPAETTIITTNRHDSLLQGNVSTYIKFICGEWTYLQEFIADIPSEIHSLEINMFQDRHGLSDSVL
jgi:hypothetical protein